jgi:hypothetical protein
VDLADVDPAVAAESRDALRLVLVERAAQYAAYQPDDDDRLKHTDWSDRLVERADGLASSVSAEDFERRAVRLCALALAAVDAVRRAEGRVEAS